MAQNYQLQLDKELEAIKTAGTLPRLLLHSCCAPCSSYVLEYLSEYFAITVLYYNPNISPKEEFDHRAEEQQRLIREMPLKHPAAFRLGEYKPEEFDAIAKGREDMPEGSARCFDCYRLRLEEAAKIAKTEGFDYFTTTLSISPLKNAQKLNEIGEALSTEYGVSYLYADFKKREGYKRSCRLAADYHLYRQNYCGCIHSKHQAQAREAAKVQEKAE